MADIGHHLNDSEYANWMKNTLALKITLDILKPYVDKELTNIQASITESFPPGAACSSCNVYTASDCPNNVCNVFQNAIIENHRTAEPSFRNTNAKKWNTDAWEIAKCFMPSMTGYRDCTQSDADFSGIINIIINCKHFDALVTCDLNQDRNMFCEAKDMRNMLMHSGSLKVSKANLQKNLDLLVGLLSCFNITPPNTNEALEQIQKLQTGELQISLDDVLYARKHVVLAIVEEFDKGKEKIQDFLNLCIEKLTHEIKTSSSIWKAQQHRLISNFIKGCKHSLIRLVESESESVKPKRYPEHKWNFKKFLNRIELFQDVESLLDRHKRLLYPEDGSTSDISKWDIFLLCHILSIETRVHLPNHLVNYVRELKALRDKILDDPDSIEEEDLEMLSGFLDEPLRTEIKSIYSRSDTTDDALQLLTVLKSWQANEDNMECKQIGTKALEQTKIQAIRIDEVENKQSEDRAEIAKLREEIGTIKAQNAGTQKQLHELSQKFEKLSGESKGEGNGNVIEASVEIRPRNCDPEQAELIQNNITSEDVEENVSLANDGLNQFQKQMNLDTVKTVKGSIILRVTCRSIKELIRFWDNCMDGSAVEALSKVRDDYRRLLGCDTLDFDIVLTKKEVHRCMNHLVHRMASQAMDETILKEIKDKVAMLQTFQAETEDLAEERKQLDTEVMMQVSKRDLSEMSQQAKQIEELLKIQKEMQEKMRQFEEKLKMGSLADSEADGVSDSIETEIEIKPKHCTREEKEKLQNNIITKNGKENIAIAQGGADHFKTELNLESLKPSKGSIILKVTCKSVNDLLLFWESCMNGKALKALSKIRDDYTQFLKCNTLDFDIVLTKKEVNRCMNQLVERLSSKLLDERFRKVQEKATMLKIKVEDSYMGERKREKKLSSEIWQKRMAEDKPIMPLISAVKEGVKRGEEKVVMRMTSLIEKPSLDVHTQGPSGQGTLKKGTKYSEYDATRLVKFLEEIAENFEEGKISVIKPYLEQLIKHSKDRDKEAFQEVIMDFTEATKFRSGISVSLMKQTFRGFRMILTEPEFGDLVAAKVEEIEKREELMGGVDSKAWQIDPKISAEDIQVGDKIAKEPSKTSDKPDQRAGTSKGFEYHKTEKDVSSESKLSPIQVFKKDVSSSKVESFKMKSTELAMEEDKPKSMESMSFKRKPGSPGSVEATEISPAPKS